MARLVNFTGLFGPRFSRQRRIINVVMLVLVGLVLAWLVWSSQTHDTRITMLERSDCKESRVSGDPGAKVACDSTLDHADRRRPIAGICIAFERAKYPCPLTEAQAREIRRVLNQKGGR